MKAYSEKYSDPYLLVLSVVSIYATFIYICDSAAAIFPLKQNFQHVFAYLQYKEKNHIALFEAKT